MAPLEIFCFRPIIDMPTRITAETNTISENLSNSNVIDCDDLKEIHPAGISDYLPNFSLKKVLLRF